MENRLRVPPILVKVAASLLGKVAVVLPGKLFVASVTPPVACWPVLWNSRNLGVLSDSLGVVRQSWLGENTGPSLIAALKAF